MNAISTGTTNTFNVALTRAALNDQVIGALHRFVLRNTPLPGGVIRFPIFPGQPDSTPSSASAARHGCW